MTRCCSRTEKPDVGENSKSVDLASGVGVLLNHQQVLGALFLRAEILAWVVSCCKCDRHINSTHQYCMIPEADSILATIPPRIL